MGKSASQDSQGQRETTVFQEKSVRMAHLDNQLVFHSVISYVISSNRC